MKERFTFLPRSNLTRQGGGGRGRGGRKGGGGDTGQGRGTGKEGGGGQRKVGHHVFVS